MHTAHVAIPIVVGGMMYLAFRSTRHLLFSWVDAVGLTPTIAELRALTTPPTNEWLLYSLPDGLWLYAFAVLLRSLWHGSSWEARGWRWLPLALALGSELAQGLGWLEGTFDPADVVTYLVFYGVAMVTARRAPTTVEAIA